MTYEQVEKYTEQIKGVIEEWSASVDIDTPDSFNLFISPLNILFKKTLKENPHFKKLADEVYAMDHIKNAIRSQTMHMERYCICMEGVNRDLLNLSSILATVYRWAIFYLSYWKSDCAWHGWSWESDEGEMRRQANLTDDITEKFKEIMAIIRCAIDFYGGRGDE